MNQETAAADDAHDDSTPIFHPVREEDCDGVHPDLIVRCPNRGPFIPRIIAVEKGLLK